MKQLLSEILPLSGGLLMLAFFLILNWRMNKRERAKNQSDQKNTPSPV